MFKGRIEISKNKIAVILIIGILLPLGVLAYNLTPNKQETKTETKLTPVEAPPAEPEQPDPTPTPTPATTVATPKPAPAPRTVRKTAGVEQWRHLCGKYFPGQVENCLAIMGCESGGNQFNANWTDNHGVCKGSFGLMQISCHSGQVFDPDENVRLAMLKYQASLRLRGNGWLPWKNCAAKVGLL